MPIRVSGEGVGQDLQRDVAAELRVGGAIDLPGIMPPAGATRS